MEKMRKEVLDLTAHSPSKINVGEIFKFMAPDTSVKVI